MKANPIKNAFDIKNEQDGKSTIYLYGTVGGYYNGISLSSVKDALEQISTSNIEVHINSYGGDLFEGIAIKNLLKQREEKITVYIDGIAASAASIIAMAGDEIIMPADAQLMIHNPWTYAAGNAVELRKIADDLEKSQTSLEESYMKRFVGTRDELKALLDEETQLTAEEAIAFGLADRLDEEFVSSEDPISAKATLIQKLALQATGKASADFNQAGTTPDSKKELKEENLFLKNLINIMEEK